MPALSGRVAYGTGTKIATLSFRPVADTSVIDSALNSAVGSGLLTAAQASAINDSLKMRTSVMYGATFGLESYAPPDNYSVDVVLTDASGVEVSRTSTGFVYLGLIAFDLDFNTVDFGKVLPAASSNIVGDNLFVLNDGRPTIRNLGNVPFRPGLTFNAMVDVSGVQRVTDFRSQFFGEGLGFKAGQLQCFTKYLVPGQTAAMSFFIQPPLNMPVSTYSGSLYVSTCSP